MGRPSAADAPIASIFGGGKTSGHPSEPATLDENLRCLVRAFLADSSLEDDEFGQLVLGDPKFVANLDNGRPLTLKVADRLLRFMGETPIGPTFRSEVAAYLTVTGMRGSSFGEKAVGNSSFMSKLKRGISPSLHDVQKVRRWIRKTTDDEQRAAIATAITDDGQPERVFFSDPTEIQAPAEGAASTTSVDEQTSDRTLPDPELKIFLTTSEAATLLRLSRRTLDGYRSTGAGPAYYVFGNRVVYSRADLLTWAWTKRRGLHREVL